MSLRFLLLWLTCGLLLLAACSTPEDPPAADYLTRIPDPKTLGESYVSNPDSLLDPATVQDLNATLQTLDQSGRAHIDVVAVRSIGEEVPKTAVTALFNRWKIGDKDQNNGLLLLLVLDQRRVEMETGYGLEADLPDVTCFRIQQQYMVPLLREERYDEAVRQGVAALIRQLSTGSFVLPTDSASQAFDNTYSNISPATGQSLSEVPAATGEPAWYWGAIIGFGILSIPLYLGLWFTTTSSGSRYRVVLGLAIVLPVVVFGAAVLSDGAVAAGVVILICYGLPLLYAHAYLWRVNRQLRTEYAAQTRHEQYIFLHKAHHNLGFTAWLFPLGLAFYWPRHRQRLRELREAPYACPACATPMHRLDEKADDEKLTLHQVAEEHVQSVDYDVWQCPQCPQTFTLDYRNLSTDVLPCPKCHHHTFQPKPDRVMSSATTSSEGWGWHIHRCYFCNHEQKEKYTIARISTSSGSSSGSSGSSSSSSSSSSSGGSSGGGGAGSSW